MWPGGELGAGAVCPAQLPLHPWLSLPPRCACEGAGPALLFVPRGFVGFVLAGSVSRGHLDPEERHQELFESGIPALCLLRPRCQRCWAWDYPWPGN